MGYFETRGLKKEILELDGKLKKSTNSEEYLRGEINTRDRKVRKAETDLQSSEKEVEKLLKKIKRLEGTVRDQTGADLLVNALQELGVVPSPKKAENPQYHYEEQARLQGQLGMQNSLAQQSGLQGASPYQGAPFWYNVT